MTALICPCYTCEAPVFVSFSFTGPYSYNRLQASVFVEYHVLVHSQSFDKSKKGMVHLDEFISLCIFVQSARYVPGIALVSIYTVQEKRILCTNLLALLL
jgi:hypothetical protein